MTDQQWGQLSDRELLLIMCHDVAQLTQDMKDMREGKAGPCALHAERMGTMESRIAKVEVTAEEIAKAKADAAAVVELHAALGSKADRASVAGLWALNSAMGLLIAGACIKYLFFT